jgi:hypothetical protein
MHETAHPMNAADLLVHGTFALRRERSRLAHPIRPLALPALQLDQHPSTVRCDRVQSRPIGSAEGPAPRLRAERPFPDRLGRRLMRT